MAGVAALAWGEWMNWRWSRALVGRGEGASVAVVVLGYRNPRATANVVNRWRVRAGIRSVGADGADGADGTYGARPVRPVVGAGGPRGRVGGRAGCYFRPLLIAFTSSPSTVSPLNSQKNAPPRPWLFAQAILVPTVAGVS